MKQFIGIALSVLLIAAFSAPAEAQYANRKLSKNQQAYIDSLKQVEYNYIFPIGGQQAYSRGFDIPYPVGLMVNYIHMDQGILIDNFQLGLQTDNLDIPLTPADFLEFGHNTNVSYAFNFRPDVWVLPFLNVYGLFGYGSSTTSIHLLSPVEIQSTVQQNMTTMGFGIMGAFGLGPLWMSVDGNWTWTFPELLEEPVNVRVLGVRLGKTFQFKKHPERNIGIWVGGMRGRMGSTTLGEIRMGDAIPGLGDNAERIVEDYNAWYEGLGPAMKQRVDESALPGLIDAIDQVNGDAIVSYGMDKAPVEDWNMVVGAQFQWNKRWQFRTEAGLVGDRKSFMLSLNYRFRL